LYFDTGVMYRAVTREALRRGIPISDETAVTSLAETISINVTPPTVDDGRQYDVLVDGRDVTWEIRQPDVDAHVSPVSAYAGVRRALTAQQRAIALRGQVVMVGRDIGTVVLPEAEFKIYLDASPEERARRRLSDKLALGCEIDYGTVLETIHQRDRIDSGREIAPLRRANDALYLNNDEMTLDEEVAYILGLFDCPE
jgi:cytidylate kinase